MRKKLTTHACGIRSPVTKRFRASNGEVVLVYRKPEETKKGKTKAKRSVGRPKKALPKLPRKPTSAYHIFAEEHRPKVAERLLREGGSDERESGIRILNKVNSELSTMWRGLSKDSEKMRRYRKLASEDKARYKSEMKAYVAPEGFGTVSASVLRPRSSYMHFYMEKVAETKSVSRNSPSTVSACVSSKLRGALTRAVHSDLRSRARRSAGERAEAAAAAAAARRRLPRRVVSRTPSARCGTSSVHTKGPATSACTRRTRSVTKGRWRLPRGSRSSKRRSEAISEIESDRRSMHWYFIQKCTIMYTACRFGERYAALR